MEEILRNINKPNIKRTQHKQNLRRALLNSSHFEEKKYKFSFKDLLMPKFTIPISALSLVTVAVLATSLLATPLTAQKVLAEIEDNYQTSAAEQGRYYYSKQKISISSGSFQDEFIEELWEDLRTGDSRSKATDLDGSVQYESAFIDGSFYNCTSCTPLIEVDAQSAIIAENFESPYSDIISDEEWMTLSQKEIDEKLIAAGERPVSSEGDPFYDMSSFEIQTLSNELDEILIQLFPNGENMSMSPKQIVEALNANGHTKFDTFFSDDPFYEFTPEEMMSMSPEEFEAIIGEDLEGMSVFNPDMDEEGYYPEDAAQLELLDKIWSLKENKDNKSRIAMIEELKSNPDVNFISETKWEGQDVVGFEIIQNWSDGVEINSTFFFGNETFNFIGSEETGVDPFLNEPFSSKFIILEEKYSEVNTNINTEGLTKEASFEGPFDLPVDPDAGMIEDLFGVDYIE